MVEKGDGLRAQEPAQDRPLRDVGEAVREPRPPAFAGCLHGWEGARREQDSGDEQKRGRVEQQRGLDAEPSDHEPAERRPERPRGREPDVEKRVSLTELPGRAQDGGRSSSGRRE